MSRFKGLQVDTKKADTKKVAPKKAATQTAPQPKGREGKKGIVGHFSPELRKALASIALEEDKTLQAVMGEAFDLFLRSRGKHPFGET